MVARSAAVVAAAVAVAAAPAVTVTVTGARESDVEPAQRRENTKKGAEDAEKVRANSPTQH